MRVRAGVMAVVLLLLGMAVPAAAAGTIEEWSAALEAREAGMASAESLREELLSRAGEAAPIDRWRRLVKGDAPTEELAADALALLKAIYPGGDPSRWEEVKGFWLPADVPKPLVALDAVFYGAWALLSMNDARAPWLARSLVEALAASDRGRTFGFRMAPIEVRDLLEDLSAKAPPPPVGGWPQGIAIGNLPYAHAVSGWISEGRATMENMTFLNAYGVPMGGSGAYAWDREEGRIYRVIDDDDDPWYLFD